MRKLFTFLFGVFAIAAFGQTFQETFESGDIPGTWTVVNTNDTYKWSIAPYEGTSDLERTISGYEQGGAYAVSSQTGRAMDDVTPDQWLISPSVSVESGDVLNFMMGHNSSYNGNANVKDENKVKFEVVVSTTGTAPEDFTYTLFSIVPESAKNWSNYSFSLDQFAGQQIHIAFHDYGTTASIPYITNTLYLDDIRINKEKVSDLQVTGITSPVSSCNTQQFVTATVSNIGFDCQTYTMNCQIDGGEKVSETVNTPLAGGSTATYTFTSPALLVAGSAHEVKVWAEASSDSNHDNDAFATEVEIGDEIPFPFSMTDDNAETTFSSSYTRTSGWVTMGWAYYNDAMMKGWVYNSGLTSYLLSNCIALPKGAVKLSFDYMALSTAKLNVYLVTEPGVYDYLAGSIDLPAAEEYTAGSMTLSVPDDGIYTIAITPDDSYFGSFYLDYIKIDEAGADVAVVSVDSPMHNATLAKSGVTVAATFRNAGGETLTDIPVCYQFDDGEIVRETIDRIEAGESAQHTFTSTIDLSAIGSHTLKVWAEFDGDTEPGNDSATRTISAYEAYDFPFEASFEADEQNDNWITYNADNDILYWEITQVIDGNINYAKDGVQAAYMSSASGIEHNDWLISPAINASEGNARISFYYTTRMSSSSGDDGCNIKLYLATTDNPDEISKGEPLAVFTLTDENVLVYKQGYSPVEIPADGTYYVAFYNDGMGHDIILDDIRFDQSEDLSILSASNSSVSGFNLTENTVTMEISNHGMTAQSGFKATYSVNGGAPVEETVQQSIAPGESLQYSFSNKVDVSVPGTYQISVSVVADNDADTYNNNWTLPEFTSYANAGLPYDVDFDTEEQRAQWTASGNWMVAANMTTSQSAYNGKGALYHTGAAPADGDWVYSGCIEIPAGTYDFSFFYRTFMNMTDVERYGQNFSIYLGKEQNPEAMTIPLYSVEGTVVTTKVYEKVLKQVEIEESGNYYIGVKCTTTSSWGTLYIDMITLEAPATEGLVLGTYESDFADNLDEWYQYNPADNFKQWESGEGVDGASCLTASTTSYFFYDDMAADLPGLLVAPAFKLHKGDEINASLDYRIAVDNIDDLTEEDKARIKIGVYLADKNLPQAFTTQMALGTTISDGIQTATGKVTIPADGIYYVGILADGQRSAISNIVTSSYELYGVKLWNDDNGGISNATGQKLFVYANNTVHMLGDYTDIKVYAVSGTLVGQYSGIDEIYLGNLPKGIYVITVNTDNGAATDKVIVR